MKLPLRFLVFSQTPSIQPFLSNQLRAILRSHPRAPHLFCFRLVNPRTYREITKTSREAAKENQRLLESFFPLIILLVRNLKVTRYQPRFSFYQTKPLTCSLRTYWFQNASSVLNSF